MDESQDPQEEEKITKKISTSEVFTKPLLGVMIAAVVLGVATGYILSQKSVSKVTNPLVGTPKTPQQDIRTFRDFAEGVVKTRPAPSNPSEYVEGTHLLQREGAVPVALTSSVVDLSQYEGKKVKVFGETQKALKEGWLMDVGRVEEIK